MKNIVFVTGTDTGVGKTTVSTLLLSGLREQGVRPWVLKPVETGCLPQAGGQLFAADAEALRSAAETSQPADSHCLYAFRAPVAPCVAAAAERRSIDIEYIRNRIAELAQGAEILLVEGAGGILVPILEEYSFADLAADCEMSCLLVVGSRLGALNHATLTFELLRQRGLRTIGYVLNELHEGRVDGGVSSQSSNRELLRRLAAAYPVRELSYIPRLSSTNENDQRDLQEGIQQLTSAVIECFALNR
jgi:dethiobiotin synthetase